MVQVDIVIPHLGADDRITDLCRACLRSIARCSTADYRLIFIDNASPAYQFERILPYLEEMPHLLVRNTRNLGFVKATNQGIWLSTAPFVVLMNNDTEAVEGWLEKLEAPITADPRIGLTGPRTTTPNSWQGRAPAGEGYRILPPGAMLAYFCTMFQRKVFDRLGVLDESYGVGFGDDDEFSRRAQRAGYHLALVQDLVIPHHHRTTFHTLYTVDEVKAMQDRAIAHFRETA